MFDPLYFIVVGPGMLLALWAQFKVKSTLAEAKQQQAGSRLSGAEVAYRILQSNGLERSVGIETTDGFMGDHYDPKAKVLRLSQEIYHGRDLAALGVAAHEAGHAIQDAKNYAPLGLRNAIVPMASIGSNFSYVVIFLGLIMQSMGLVLLGVGLFSIVVIFQLINLPVEFDASRRAKEILFNSGYVSASENAMVAKVLSAAAMTYVAATVTSILTLAYYLLLARNRE